MSAKWMVSAAAVLLLTACGSTPTQPKDPQVAILSSGAEQAIPNGVAKTYAANVGVVRQAILKSLLNMDVKVVADSKTDQGWRIMALADERTLMIQLESVSPTMTRMRVVIDRGGWDDKGIEVVLRVLDAVSPGADIRPA
jgi:hypothetical protein